MSIKKLLFIILAILGGEIALILFTTIAQEVLFDGISYQNSPLFDIVFGGLATFIAAILAGVVARLIIKTPIKVVPLAISIIITTETIYLIYAHVTTGPLWFDLLAGAALIVGIWLGFYYSMLSLLQKRLVTK